MSKLLELHTLNMYSLVCQLHLNIVFCKDTKTEEIKIMTETRSYNQE